MLELPDRDRCQAEHQSTFMTLGPKFSKRCKNKPVWIAYEKEVQDDGLKGSMSLCDDCRDYMKSIMPGHCTFRRALDEMEKETIKRCTNTMMEGEDHSAPGAVCAVAWLGRKANGGVVPRSGSVNRMAKIILGECLGLIHDIYNINDENPTWTWEQIARELRTRVLPNVKD